MPQEPPADRNQSRGSSYSGCVWPCWEVSEHGSRPGLAEPCNGLAADERVQKSTGAAVRHGMSCAALGEAIVKASAGDAPGRHTQAQAQALKDVLVALGSSKAELALDPALRVPLATALVHRSARDARRGSGQGRRADYAQADRASRRHPSAMSKRPRRPPGQVARADHLKAPSSQQLYGHTERHQSPPRCAFA